MPAVDLHPDRINNMHMGTVFEELIRRFAETSNDTAEEHFTPREIIRLMVHLLFVEDDDVLSKPGVVRTIYDPAAGTGGMLSIADEHLEEHNRDARLIMHGQELNELSYAICKADMLIKGQDVRNIVCGNTLSQNGHPNTSFDYVLSNAGGRVEEGSEGGEAGARGRGFNGRFGPGLPRVSDGSLLFLMHQISKMRPTKDGGSRFAIVVNGSPLFTGGTATALFGGCLEAQFATVLDHEGREVDRVAVAEDETPPEPPEVGRVKLAPLSLLLPIEAFGYRQITVSGRSETTEARLCASSAAGRPASRRQTRASATPRTCR